MSLNKILLIGNVGQTPDVKYLDGGLCVAKFSLATTETWKDKDGNKKESTTWHNIEAWRKTAEIVEKYVHKGDLLYIEGKIKNSEYTDKDNIKRYRTDIVVESLQMLGGKREQATGQVTDQATAQATAQVNEGSNGGTSEGKPDPADLSKDEQDDMPF
jgi:single-strand DNA-binding protein